MLPASLRHRLRQGRRRGTDGRMTPPFHLVGEESPCLQPRLGGPNVTLEGARSATDRVHGHTPRVFRTPPLLRAPPLKPWEIHKLNI